jgi:hypothetical protein
LDARDFEAKSFKILSIKRDRRNRKMKRYWWLMVVAGNVNAIYGIVHYVLLRQQPLPMWNILLNLVILITIALISEKK